MKVRDLIAALEAQAVPDADVYFGPEHTGEPVAIEGGLLRVRDGKSVIVLAELKLDAEAPGLVSHCEGADVIIPYYEAGPGGCRPEDAYELADGAFSRSGGVACGR